MTKKEEAFIRAKEKQSQLKARLQYLENSIKSERRKMQTSRYIRIGKMVECTLGYDITDINEFDEFLIDLKSTLCNGLDLSKSSPKEEGESFGADEHI